MKQPWRVQHQPQLLLSRGYATRRGSQLSSPTRRCNGSWGAYGLHKAHQDLFSNCTWKVGNGLTIKASSDKWVCGGTPIMKDNVPIREAANLPVADLIHSSTNEWDYRQLHRFFIPSSVRQISKIELPNSSSTADTCTWPHTQSGLYSTKTGYAFALQHQQNDMYSMTANQMRLCHIIWHLNIMPKWKLFMWKLLQNSLPTSANLFRRGLIVSDVCRICLYDAEGTDHLFRHCPLAQEVWDLTPSNQVFTSLSLPFSEWVSYCLVLLYTRDGSNGASLPAFIGTLWAIWLTRNSQIFRNVRCSS